MKRSFDLSGIPADWGYSLLTATVVPRAIAWVSSLSAAGVPNLAPHSFFTVASSDPAIVQFTSVTEKDSLRNIRETGEFVIALVTEDLAAAANVTATNFPPEFNEFEEARLTPEPAEFVRPARVAESPVALECRLERIVEIGNSFLVLGRVLCVAIAEDVLDPEPRMGKPHPRYELLRPVSRLGRIQWGLPGAAFDLVRPRFEEESR
ncbi:MAG TPA: flavin reductase family protein [Propionibacterium sp.]|jgi:flavin reductase (DIM6/NTAB) family NADH-FMN oxidoreductase RutF|nr:flavin reductase family protein [Propionibacterium sp.]